MLVDVHYCWTDRARIFSFVNNLESIPLRTPTAKDHITHSTVCADSAIAERHVLTLSGFQCQDACLVHDVEELVSADRLLDFENHCTNVGVATACTYQHIIVDPSSIVYNITSSTQVKMKSVRIS